VILALKSPGRCHSSAILLGWLELQYRRRPRLALAHVAAALERFPLDSVAPADRPYAQLAAFWIAAGKAPLAGPTQGDVDKVKEQLIRAREVDLKQNAFWMNSIVTRGQTGDDVAALLAPYDAMIANLTPAQVQQAARMFFNTNNVARFVLLPEGAKAVPPSRPGSAFYGKNAFRRNSRRA
jgi:hypothetical protein